MESRSNYEADREASWRNASPGEKLIRIGELSDMLRFFHRAALRLRYPAYTPRQIHRELFLVMLGEKLVNELVARGVCIGRHLPSVGDCDEDLIDEPFVVTHKGTEV